MLQNILPVYQLSKNEGAKLKPTTADQRIDGRTNAKVLKGHVYKAEHAHPPYMEYFLNQLTANKKVLTIGTGTSPFGDIRLDIDPKSNRTEYGDVFESFASFTPGSVDYLYADLPYGFLNPLSNVIRKEGIRRGLAKPGSLAFKWQFDWFKIPKIAMITRRNLINVNLPSKSHDYYVIEDSRPQLGLMRIDYK